MHGEACSARTRAAAARRDRVGDELCRGDDGWGLGVSDRWRRQGAAGVAGPRGRLAGPAACWAARTRRRLLGCGAAAGLGLLG
jgi:hypothetical protein